MELTTGFLLWPTGLVLPYRLRGECVMEENDPDIPLLQPEDKVVGTAYLTPDGEIVFTPHGGAIEVVLVEPQPGSSGPWAVRLRPSGHHHGAIS